MDLDVDQVFMYILHKPLFSVVGHISFLYRFAARTTDTRVKEVLIAVAKEFINIMLMFDVEQQLDFRIIRPRTYIRIRSYAQIASKSCAFRLACAYAPACCSAAAWVITRLVDKINDEGTKNVLRNLIEDFNRISIAFQSVSEMIFRDRPIDISEFICRLILQHIRPWIPHIPPFPVPRVFDALVFSGVVTESMLDEISLTVNFLGDAVEETYKLLMFMEDGVALDRLFNVLTYMVIAQSLLEHHFPRNIQTSRPQDEDRVLRHRRQEVNWMLSQVSDIAIMALVEIESFTLSINSQELEEQFGFVGVLLELCTFKLFDAFTTDSH